MPLRRIVVAIKDTSVKLPPAAMKAAQLARAFHAHVELFHAIDEPLYVDVVGPSSGGISRYKRDLQDLHERRLARMASRIRSAGVKASTRVEWDFPSYEAIIRRALRTRADLLVAECHGHRHIAPGLLHIADWELVRLSPMPLLLVKQARQYRRPTLLAAVDPSHALAKPARLDSEILRMADLFGRKLRGTVHALHTYVSLSQAMPEVWAMAHMTGEMDRAARAAAAARFERLLRRSRIPQDRRHLVEHPPRLAIPRVARRIRSAIVVLGAVSRSGIKAALIGNTAEGVLDALPCDLLVIKPARFQTRVPRASRGPRYAATGLTG